MTEFEIKHGLSQDEPGPLEPVELVVAVPAARAAGWKLVPIEPTDDMEAAAENDYEQRGETFPDWKAKYRAMLAAAPASPVSTVEQEQPAAWMEPRIDIPVTNEYRNKTPLRQAKYSVPLYRHAPVAAPAAGDARAWQGLTDAERDGYVGELVDYGTDFVAPLYSVVESIEKRLREKNAAQRQGDA